MPTRTITFALHILIREGIVRRVPNLADMRQQFYHVITDRVKELQLLFKVDQVTRFQPELRQDSHQEYTFNR